MTIELNLRFPDPAQVVVRFDDEDTATLPFVNPLTVKDHQDLRWYVETYGTHSLDDPDDAEAARIRQLLPVWGKKLFDEVFHERAAQRLFNLFQDEEGETRLMTISAEHPEILSLPWELLHDSSAPDGTHLFRETISIRRRYAGAGGGRKPFKIASKDRMYLLFVVSRPDDAGFIDPRADASAVLDAIDMHAPERISVEFLRPATLDALVARLDDDSKPPVDILHFDGHGVFDREGHILEQRKSASTVDCLMKDSAAQSAPNTGYLLFEDAEHQSSLVSAGLLGENLHRRKVALVILSACQSAMQGEDEPLGCVAVRLTETGIPAVLAMTHSVLVATTRNLFGQFYQHLAQGLGLGEALDRARRHLDNHPEKYEVQRGSERVWLRLHDWFIPALYQSGADTPLLSRHTGRDCRYPEHREVNLVCPPWQLGSGDPCRNDEQKPVSTALVSGHLPERPEAGFYGRRRELWEIERGFAGPARRISLIGFGGQGKTALALEAGRWLVRTGLFDTACFVNYAEAPGRDAVAVAVAALASALGESLPDAAAATAALRSNACLLILDNLEILATETLAELLDQAKHWSEAGGSRVLLTSRRPDFKHAAYQSAGTLKHRQIRLTGLGERARPDDALDWFARLWKFPPPAVQPKPPRQALIDLFERVAFHPLSLRVLAAQLKTRRIAELGERLDHWLAQPAALSIGQEDHSAALVASLQLSLERLEPKARELLPRLGVFQGGAMEPQLLAITQIPDQAWPSLRQQLEAAALIEAEHLPDIEPPFLRFHPTLAPLLWLELNDTARAELGAAHRARYYQLAQYLYDEDLRNPHAVRAIVRRELPNLLQSVRSALQFAEPEAVNFADRVNRFLDYFGLRREQAELARLAEPLAQQTGSEAWYQAQSSRGEQLLAAGRSGEAAQVFQALLAALGETDSFRRAQILALLGRCFEAGGRHDQSAAKQQQALAVLQRLEPSDWVKRQTGSCLTDLADTLRDLGQYPHAREAYLAALSKFEALNDTRHQGVVLFQLGMLDLNESQYPEAIQRYREALNLFQSLQEPASEASAWNNLGRVYSETEQWDVAEHCYRESARIKEALDDKSGAAATWNNLAAVNQFMGKPAAAETWYRKAIDQFRADQGAVQLAKTLCNLAGLLRSQPSRLAEALRCAEESLALKQTLEPGTAQIWTTYYILARITEQQAETAERPAELRQTARDYRRRSREAFRSFPGHRVVLKQYAELIFAACSGDAETLAHHQTQMRQTDPHWFPLADALDSLRNGERDTEALLDGLDYEKALILETILRGLDDPASLEWLKD